ncbi:MAG: serine/threonine-protein kinase, partial [Dehalococcoidia bacterium]
MTQQRIGHYEILGEVGSGGQATVYRALDSNSDRIVALKVLNSHLGGDPHFRERFLREAHIAALLTHPHVVTVYEVGEDGEQLYLAMEYLPDSLHSDMALWRANISVQTVLNTIRQVASALQAAHENGIVHGDLKPQNILIADKALLKVADFGIALATGSVNLTATGTAIGTTQYVSPERARGEQVDIRSDLYSLGLILHELMTGHTPLKGMTPLETLHHHSLGLDTPLDVLEGMSLPSNLMAVMKRLLAKDAADRYQSPIELIRVLEDRPSTAATPPTPPQPSVSPAAPPAVPVDSSTVTPEPELGSVPEARSFTNLLSALRTWRPPSAWRQVPRRRVAWVGGAVVLVLALAVGVVLSGAIDQATGFFGSTSGRDSSEAMTVSVVPTSPAQVVVSSPDGASFVVRLPAGVFGAPHTLTMWPVNLNEIPEIQAEARGNLEVLHAYEVKLFTEQGGEVAYPELSKTITILATYTGQDLSRAGDESSRLTILWFNWYDANNHRWETLPTSEGPTARTLVSEVRHLSLFAIGIQSGAGPTATSTPTPPLTPGSTLSPTPVVTPASTNVPTLTATLTATPTPTQTTVPQPGLTPGPTPQVPDVTITGVWFRSGDIQGRQITVVRGSEVAVSVTLSAGERVGANLEIEIRKDLAVGADETKEICSFQVFIRAVQQPVGDCVFAADELTNGVLTQYYVRGYLDGVLLYDPQDRSTREYVQTKPGPTPTPTLTPTPAPTATPTPFNAFIDIRPIAGPNMVNPNGNGVFP